MLKKRLVGVVTVKDGWAVQSFGYRRYLPLGRPEVLVENLDRWGADEILLQCIDRSTRGEGPDFPLLESVGALGLSTPLIYAGGIKNPEDGISVVKAGADRVCLDAALHDNPALAVSLAEPLGAQAVIAALPLAWNDVGLLWRDYRHGTDQPLPGTLLDMLSCGVISETLVIDWRHEGQPGGFDADLVKAFPIKDIPLIALGGLSDTSVIRTVFDNPRVVAVGIGNFLSYKEHAVQAYKQQLQGLPLRPPFYDNKIAAPS